MSHDRGGIGADRTTAATCVLGHTQRAYECPSCGEAATGQKASLEHWRWYRGRTSSKRVKALIDGHLKTPALADDHYTAVQRG